MNTVEEKTSKRNAKERVSAYTELMREAERTFQQKEQAGVRTDAEGVCKVGAAGKNQQVTANAGTALGLCPLADKHWHQARYGSTEPALEACGSDC